ncbi:O-methyltransferase [Actinomyces minihominis]|uniref:O-methyltransferase n=1 Tax=Actinomyces minihominis TaxID=2002838 RepID=UPI000C0740F5|nr:O-methyltransferase [Actinomyces minihominis]
MSANKNDIWMFSEEFVSEPAVIASAREVAVELGADPVSTATGALLRAVAAMRNAKAVVEVGTGAGISGLWVLSGMNDRGVLTTIDPEPEFQQSAAMAFRAAQVPSSRTRFINGRALDVLPRLADSSYDMVILDALPEETAQYVQHALRLLRPSGALVIPNALWFGNVANPARRDPHTVAMREVVRELLDSEDFLTTLLPTGDGVLIAVRPAPAL